MTIFFIISPLFEPEAFHLINGDGEAEVI
jgi:hypothetical protein